MDLEANLFSNLSQLLPLIRSAPGLKSLNLRFNVITQIECAEPGTTCFPKTLSSLNLSFNRINNWRQIAALNIVFPGIRDLRISRNPLYEQAAGKIQAPEDEDYLDETSRYLLTVAHLPRLVTLNYATITAADRLNADLYYISRARTKITKLRETISGSEFEVARDKLLLEYPRWYELCDQYGESTNVFITEQKKERWMESRLISFTFLFTRSEGSAPTQKVLKIPRTTDIYRLKGIVWKLFGIPTPHVRLIWETDVWDPLEPDELSDGEDDGGDEGREGYGGDTGESDQKGHDQAKWKRREVELVDSPREVGFWIEGRGARVRVERS